MSDQALRIAAAIRAHALPPSLSALVDRFEDGPQIEFHGTTPHNLVLGQGARIICSLIAFHNSGGGILGLGAGPGDGAPQERLNLPLVEWVLTNWADHAIPLTSVTAPHPLAPGLEVEMVLVPPRQGAGLLRLRQGFDRFDAGSVLVRQGCKVVAAGGEHFDLLCGTGATLAPPAAPIRSALPAPPSRPFVGRERELIGLLQWFTQGEARRLSLHGPAGVGRTALALEFARRLTQAGAGMRLPGGARLDHVLFVGGTPQPGGDPAMNRFGQILSLAGAEQASEPDHALTEWLDRSSGLIIIDEPEAISDERLLIRLLGARRHNKVLYTTPAGGSAVSERSILVGGFSADAEFGAFCDACAAGLDIPAPATQEVAAIASFSHGLPGRIEGLFARRAQAGSYAKAMRGGG